MSPVRNVVLIILIIWIQSIVSKECSFQKVTILNNVYSMRTLKTFNNTPSNVFYENEIEYIYDNITYQYNMNSGRERKIITNASPINRNVLVVKSDVDIKLDNLKTNQTANVKSTSDERLISAKYKGLILTVRHSKSLDSQSSGKLHAFNETDLNTFGDFIITQWVKELGSNVSDVAINPTTGNIVVSALNANKQGILILLEQKSKYLCPDINCIQSDTYIKDNVAKILNGVQDRIISSVEQSIENSMPDFKAQIQQKDKLIYELNVTLSSEAIKLNDLLEEYEKQEEFIVSGESIVKVNSNVNLKTKRDAKDDRKMCTSKAVYQNNYKTLKKVIELVRGMQNLVEEYYAPPKDKGPFGMSYY